MSNQIGRSDFDGYDADAWMDAGAESDTGIEDAGDAGSVESEVEVAAFEPPLVGPSDGAAESEEAHASGALKDATVVPMRRLPGSPGDLPDPELPKGAVGGFYATWKADVYVDDVSPMDPSQGQLGDCFLISAMSAAAMTDPEQLKSRIKDHGDGTYTVRLSEKAADGSLKDVSLTVDADFIVDPSSFPVGTDASTMNAMPADVRLYNARSGTLGDNKELWPTIVEKAYAKWKGGYEAISNGGYMHESLTALTGHDTTYGDSSAGPEVIWKDVTSALKDKRPILASTKFPSEAAVETGYVPGHAYTVMGASEKDGKKFITLRNPWGNGEPGADGKDDGVFTIDMAEYQRNFGVHISTTGKPPAKPTPEPEPKATAPVWRNPFAGWGGNG